MSQTLTLDALTVGTSTFESPEAAIDRAIETIIAEYINGSAPVDEELLRMLAAKRSLLMTPNNERRRGNSTSKRHSGR